MSVLDLLDLIEKPNVAENLNSDDLHQIGEMCVTDYMDDDGSRSEWLRKTKESMQLAMQIVDPKSHPWPDCANIAYPLVTVAAISGASRIFPEVVKDDSVISFKILGMDADGTKAQAANRLADFHSYQLLCQNKNWSDETDKLLHMLFVIGTVFRKAYFDPLVNFPRIDLCNPNDIIVNNRLTNLQTAERITHRFCVSKNYIIERIRAGLYRDIDLACLSKVSAKQTNNTIDTNTDNLISGNQESNKFSDNGFYELIEQHRYLDLDEDGYAEPYIVIVHTGNNEVLAIYPRFTIDSIRLNEKNEIQHIEPEHYFSDYHLIPAPDGSFYSLGLGSLLLPINNSINSLINNLIDAGTLSNLQTGVYSRLFKLRNNKLKMGEFTPVDVAPGSRIQDMITPMPFKEPSQVLFQLLGMLVQAGNQIASINEVLLGQALPQNAPSGSTQEIAQQGLKMFSSIYKRFCHNLSYEFEILYHLNKKHLNELSVFDYNQNTNFITPEDFQFDDIALIPVADPSLSSESQRVSQTMTLVNLFNTPLADVLNPYETVTRILEQMRMSNPEALIAQPQPQQPDPAALELQLKAQELMLRKEQKDKELMIKAQEVLTKQAQVKIKAAESSAKILKMKADADKDRAEAAATNRKYSIEQDKVRVMEKKVDADARRTS